MNGQFAGRGQFFAVLKPTGENALRDHLLDLLLQGALRLWMKKERLYGEGHGITLVWT